MTRTFDTNNQTNKFDFGTGHAIKFATHVLRPFDLTVLFVPIDDPTLSSRLIPALGPAECIPYAGATSNASLGNCGFYHVDSPPENGIDYDGLVTVTVWWDFPTLDLLHNVRLYRAPLDGSDNSCPLGFECYTQDITDAVYAVGDSQTGDPGVKGTGPGFSDFEAVDLTSPTSAAARVWIGLKDNSGGLKNHVGTRFDLKAEVSRNGSLVSTGSLLGAPGGGPGFGNAMQRTIPLSLPAGTFASGDAISMQLFVRNSCVGSSANSDTARLWFNDAAANSRVDEPGLPTLYLVMPHKTLDLSSSTGKGKKTTDGFVGAPVPSCNGPYMPFGTWTALVP